MLDGRMRGHARRQQLRIRRGRVIAACIVVGVKGSNRWVNSMTTTLEKLDALSRQSADT